MQSQEENLENAKGKLIELSDVIIEIYIVDSTSFDRNMAVEKKDGIIYYGTVCLYLSEPFWKYS